MLAEFLDVLACPACGAPLGVSEDAPGLDLVCRECPSRFPARDGLLVLLPPSSRPQDPTALAFGVQWRMREADRYEEDTLYGETAEDEVASLLARFGLDSPSEFNGTRILDVGCGSGRLTQNLARLAPGALVVGGDRSDAARLAHERCLETCNAQVLQMDLMQAPLRTSSFDYVYADGVLPHVADPEMALRSLDRIVRPGGRLFVWVYPRSFSPYRLLRDALVCPYRFPLAVQRAIEWTFGIPLWLAFKLYEPWRGPRRRSFREILFMLHDNLAPEYQHRRHPQELVAAFSTLGYVDVRLVGPATGVVGTKAGTVHG